MNYFKKIFAVSILLLTIACDNKPKQASIEGTIENLPSEITEVILKTETNLKTIKIENGTFKDTISVDGAYAYLQIGEFGKILYLDKETNLVINVDAENYQNTISYSGNGKEANTYLNKRELITQKVFVKIDSINSLDKTAFNNYVDNMHNDINALLEKGSDFPELLIKTEEENLEFFIKGIKKQYTSINGGDNGNLKKGDVSPGFDYENYSGEKTKLSDLKGNYVYIDIWATWCKPCTREIPSLKKLEEKFHKKNIKFVSISIDSPNAKDKWKAMIKDKEMGGVQLFANGNEDFVMNYQVTGIPRFILLDTEGKIISADAPRPSSGQINDLLKNLP